MEYSFDDPLLERVLQQLKEDLSQGIEKEIIDLLKSCRRDKLVEYLPEEEQEKFEA